MKSKLLIGAVALVFVGVLGVAFLEQPSASYTAPASDTAAQDSTTRSPAQTTPATGAASSASASSSTHAAGYTMAEVAKHGTASSCWTAINGNVYDVTSWINQHPGGPERIIALCGTDGSAAFNGQHGGQARPASELARFLLGPLAQG